MNERRRTLLRTAGIALLSAVAACTEQSGGTEDSQADDEESSTPEGTATSAAPGTETRADTETTTAVETDVSNTDTPGDAETGTPSETAAPSDSLALVIDNVGARAWEVTQDESGSVAPTGETNPTLSFEVGRRYAVENQGWSAHPFAIRDADGAPLLSQSADGRFEGDDAVNWTDDGETFAFTYTAELASAADYYICTAHAGMRGDVETA